MTGDVSSGNHNVSLKLTIRLSSSQRFDIGSSSSTPTITPSSTINHVKEIISTREESGRCPVERQRLIHKGRILSDNGRTLADYGIGGSSGGSTDGSGEGIVLYLVKGSAGSTGGGNTAAATTPNTSSSSGAAAPTAGGVPVGSTPSTGGMAASSNPPNFNPFLSGSNNNSGLSNMMSMMGGGMPDMAQIQREMQNNPQMMQEMLNNPMVQSLMNSPDFLQNMMENNPQMRQVLDSNPELRHALQDPEFMRRSMQMMRDPGMMQNMMRNQDLAMSQIENMPGGYNALRRMYEDVQAPMMDAMTGNNERSGSGEGSGSNNNSGGDGTDGASNRAMPNPWGAPPASSANNSNSNQGGGAAAANPFASPWGSMGMPNLGASNPAGSTASSNPWANPMSGDNNANLEAAIQMLENPIMNQMVQNMMSNPEAMQQMMDSNPMMRQMRETNPQAAAMLSNPETMRAMMNPNNLRAMLQMQQAMQQLGGFPGLGPMAAPNSSTSTGTAPPPAAGGLDFSSLLGAGATAPSNPGSSVANPFLPFLSSAMQQPPSQQSHSQPAPGERFRQQLQSLQDMGFTDRSANIRALTSGHGNVNRAIEILLENPPEMGDSTSDQAPPSSAGNVESPASGQNESTGNEGDGNSEPKGSVEKKND